MNYVSPVAADTDLMRIIFLSSLSSSLNFVWVVAKLQSNHWFKDHITKSTTLPSIHPAYRRLCGTQVQLEDNIWIKTTFGWKIKFYLAGIILPNGQLRKPQVCISSVYTITIFQPAARPQHTATVQLLTFMFVCKLVITGHWGKSFNPTSHFFSTVRRIKQGLVLCKYSELAGMLAACIHELRAGTAG